MERTKIEWCDHTFNPWIGCTNVSPGCDNCYAEKLAVRWKAGWGHGQPRKRTASSTWNLPRRWDRRCEKEGIRERVFCASLADVFDNEVPDEWRRELFQMIEETPNLDWLLLTKRPELARRWWSRELLDDILPNVWLGTSVENQSLAAVRIPILVDIPAAVRFLSCEPLLDPLDFFRIEPPASVVITDATNIASVFTAAGDIDWVICGGESGPRARYMHPDWARQLRDDCKRLGIAFFMKQMAYRAAIPDDLVVREFPR